MNCLNGEEYLREAIESVYAQTYTNWEIIFWDNASTDDTATIVQTYDSKLKYFKGENTVPLGQARNLALEKCQGDFIAFLDSDDVWFPRKLEKQIEIIQNNREIDFIYSNYYKMINTQKDSMKLAYKRMQPEGDVFKDFVFKYEVLISSVVVSKRAIKSLAEWFDDRFNQLEEYDVFMRILYSQQAAYIHEGLAIYRYHENMISTRSHEYTPREYPIIFQKFKSMISDFEILNPEISNYIIIQIICYSQAKLDILQGRYLIARQSLNPHKYYSIRVYILYLSTFLPFNSAKCIYNALLFLKRKI